MFGLFKKKGNKVKQEVKKLQNRDYLEAVLGASVLVAAADGSIDDSELATLDALVKINPAFEGFGGEISEILRRFKAQFDISFRIGKTSAMREIADINCEKEQSEDLINIILTVAEADGEIDEHEQKLLEEIASALGLNVADYV